MRAWRVESSGDALPQIFGRCSYVATYSSRWHTRTLTACGLARRWSRDDRSSPRLGSVLRSIRRASRRSASDRAPFRLTVASSGSSRLPDDGSSTASCGGARISMLPQERCGSLRTAPRFGAAWGLPHDLRWSTLVRRRRAGIRSSHERWRSTPRRSDCSVNGRGRTGTEAWCTGRRRSHRIGQFP